MATAISLTAQLRDGSATPKALRRAQIIPGVMYGRKYEPRSLQFDYRSLASVVRIAGPNIVITLEIEGENTPESVLIRDVQRDPISENILHVDLYRVVADERITSMVPLVERGRAPAIDRGCVVSIGINAIEVECLPKDMPPFIEVDLSRLVDEHSHITVADLVIPPDVTVLTPETTEVAHAMIPRMMVEEEVVEVPEEIEEAEAAEEESPSEDES
ncbi:MAG: hypothetical protein A2Y73_09290 [Chloroflexi bacterium RBG_13_56_8]|nr:MAG: hypothetical protein A2Y73_09290 [Chloroflexi bacterium RBG_13_56_8]